MVIIINLGAMEEFIKVIGRTESNMVKENFTSLRKELGKKAFGAMEKESNGSMINKHQINFINNF